jgi:hypothetical protein
MVFLHQYQSEDAFVPSQLCRYLCLVQIRPGHNQKSSRSSHLEARTSTYVSDMFSSNFNSRKCNSHECKTIITRKCKLISSPPCKHSLDRSKTNNQMRKGEHADAIDRYANGDTERTFPGFPPRIRMIRELNRSTSGNGTI